MYPLRKRAGRRAVNLPPFRARGRFLCLSLEGGVPVETTKGVRYMPNVCAPRSVKSTQTDQVDEAIVPCPGEVIVEATLRELREDLADIERMIRVLEWADAGSGKSLPAA